MSLRGGDSAGHGGVGHAGRRTPSGLFAFSFVLLASLFLAIGRPQEAWASTATFTTGETAEINDRTGEMTGKAHIKYLIISLYEPTTYFDVTLPDGQVIMGHCINPGAFIPLDGYYDFTGTPRGDGSYDVVVWSSASDGYNPISYHLDTWPPQNVGDIRWTPQYAGWIELAKSSGNAQLTSENDAYSLAGATYGVYSDPSCTIEVARLVTDAGGRATSAPLAAGTYYVREISPSAGYALDVTVHAVSVAANMAAKVNVTEQPAYATPPLLLNKVDAETRAAVPQGSASLAGAVYTVTHYAGFHGLDDLPASELRSFQFETDADGRIPFDRDHLVSGTPYANATGALALPLGTYVIEEASPSTGYRTSSPNRVLVHVTRDGLVEVVHSYTVPTDAESVIRGGVVVRKRDAESHATHPLGSGSFEGISFDILNRSTNPVVVGGVPYAPGTVCATIVTDDEGVARTAIDALPYGSYEIRETGHGRGYFGNTAWSRTFQVERQGELVNLRGEGAAVEDQVRRGDISFSKHEGEEGGLMPGVPWLLTSNTTGETHVLVTDENGILSTAASWNAHSGSTNANDAALIVAEDGSYAVDESLLDPEAGVWFGAATLDDESTTITAANDNLGALPYDRMADGGGYTLRELPCAANSGHRMIETTFSITRDGVTLDLGTFDNEPVNLGTTLTGEDGSHVAAADSELTLTDVVRYEGLVAGNTYQIGGELHAFDADGADLGVVATASAEIVPWTSEGETTLEFTFDASQLTGRKVVAYETLSMAGITWATHADPDDEDQTVYFPTIATVAHGSATMADDVAATGESGVMDTVSYSGLQPAEGYELIASLHLLNDDGSDGGEIARGSASFDTEVSSGSVAVWLEGIDLSTYAGSDLVVFEQLVRDGQVWATHEDLASSSQTVHLPAIRTSAASARESGVLAAGPDETIVDAVAYENLLPETTYTLQATAHVVGSDDEGLVDGGVIATADSVMFTTPAASDDAQTVSGTVEVRIPMDLTGLDGARVVVFERLLHGDTMVATHENLADEDQTVRVPALHTTATSAGDHDALATSEQRIVDEVRYENLTPGIEYTLSGSLMGLSAKGEEVVTLATSTLDFTPEEPSGSIEVIFAGVDLSGLAGGKVVAYETLCWEDTIVATHKDPSDEDQTIHVPRVSTEAHGAAGTHTALAGANQTIVDTVTYEGLLPEHTYTVAATLHSVQEQPNGTRADGGAISDPTRITFTTPAAEDGKTTVSGTIEVAMHAYLSDLAGQDVVCFEEISRGGTAIATHEDPADTGQTVSLPSISTKADATAPNAQGVVTITDRVAYENLVVGEEYEVVGTLHRKGGSGEDLGVVEAEAGKPFTARMTFVARKASGSAEVSFNVNAAALGLSGSSVVVFEELRQGEVIVARHNEISSVEQLVVFDASGTPAKRPIPQTGLGELPYVVVAILAFGALGSGLAASRKYDW